MDRFSENLGRPDIKIAGLAIWIHGYQFPDSNDYYDGNWLRASAICSSAGSIVQITGSFICLQDIVHLMDTSEKLYSRLKGKAELPCIEPELHVLLEINKLGQIEMIVNITPDHLNQEHRFVFPIDQSFLPDLISNCQSVLNEYPVRGKF